MMKFLMLVIFESIITNAKRESSLHFEASLVYQFNSVNKDKSYTPEEIKKMMGNAVESAPVNEISLLKGRLSIIAHHDESEGYVIGHMSTESINGGGRRTEVSMTIYEKQPGEE